MIGAVYDCIALESERACLGVSQISQVGQIEGGMGSRRVVGDTYKSHRSPALSETQVHFDLDDAGMRELAITVIGQAR